jgi:hypothetical protein
MLDILGINFNDNLFVYLLIPRNIINVLILRPNNQLNQTIKIREMFLAIPAS